MDEGAEVTEKSTPRSTKNTEAQPGAAESPAGGPVARFTGWH